MKRTLLALLVVSVPCATRAERKVTLMADDALESILVTVSGTTSRSHEPEGRYPPHGRAGALRAAGSPLAGGQGQSSRWSPFFSFCICSGVSDCASRICTNSWRFLASGLKPHEGKNSGFACSSRTRG